MSFESALVVILLLVICYLFYLLHKKLSLLQMNKQDQTLIEWLKTMQSSIDTTNKTLHETLQNSSTQMVKTLQENSRQLNERLDKAAAVIKDVGVEVGQMSEIGRSMKELQALLRSPKLRGNLGEEILKDLITQMFPKQSFHLQYSFSSGEKVDAAIRTDAGILPIDAKFPYENFQKMYNSQNDILKEQYQKEFIRDVKRHVEAISKKYILPEEGTMDFALMYVPSEVIYYEIVNITEIMNFAKRQRVYIVSPSTLYAHLQTILISFEGKKLENRSRELFKLLRALQVDYDKLHEIITVLGKHLNNASTQYTQLSTTYGQFGQKLQIKNVLEEETNTELTEKK